jgi:hypothetical protein
MEEPKMLNALRELQKLTRELARLDAQLDAIRAYEATPEGQAAKARAEAKRLEQFRNDLADRRAKAEARANDHRSTEQIKRDRPRKSSADVMAKAAQILGRDPKEVK